MSTVLEHEPGAVAETSARRLRTAVWQLMKDRPSAVAAAIVLGLLILVAIFAPLIAPHGIHDKIGPPFGQPGDFRPWVWTTGAQTCSAC